MTELVGQPPKPRKYIVNPPLNIVGLGPSPQTGNRPLVGFEIRMPDQTPVAILFDPDTAPLFIADLIQALNKMNDLKPKADA